MKSEVQRRARDSSQLLQTDERHPSPHFKSVGRFQSVRVTDAVRALAVKEGNDYVWVWIGTHDEYDRLIGREVIGELHAHCSNWPAVPVAIRGWKCSFAQVE